ncbi:hypothetical protein U1Q18_017431 [Sarracenia purpurea var. burkii]
MRCHPLSLSGEGQRAFSGPPFPPDRTHSFATRTTDFRVSAEWGFHRDDSCAGDSVSGGLEVEMCVRLPVFVDRREAPRTEEA